MLLGMANAGEIKQEQIAREKYCEDYKISYASTAGVKFDVYPNRFQMRKLVYVEELKCFRRLMRDVDISEIPEISRLDAIDTQNKLNQAIKDFKDGKINYVCEGL